MTSRFGLLMKEKDTKIDYCCELLLIHLHALTKVRNKTRS